MRSKIMRDHKLSVVKKHETVHILQCGYDLNEENENRQLYSNMNHKNNKNIFFNSKKKIMIEIYIKKTTVILKLEHCVKKEKEGMK